MMVLKGYKLATKYCRKNYTPGGTSLYVKADHVPRVKEIQIEQCSCERHFECCAIQLEYEKSKCCIMRVYRPPDGNYVTFYSNPSDALNYCSKTSKILFVCREMNINYLIENMYKQFLTDLLDNYNLTCTSINPTRIYKSKLRNSSGSVIDYVFTNLDRNQYITQLY